MNIVIGIFKAILVRLATKYAAELIITHTINALEKAAANTATTIDDDVVGKVKAEKDFIIKTINSAL